MKNQSLKEKVFELFDVVIPLGTSDTAAIRELDRRGKIDLKKVVQIIFLLVNELEEKE